MSNRVLGLYVLLSPEEPDFTPSDAISLALLWYAERLRNEEVAAQYRAAYLSVCAGLGLDPVDPIRLTESRVDGSPDSRQRNFPLRHLIRLRTNAVQFCDQWGSVLEGDIWGEQLPSREMSTRLADAKTWYQRERTAVARGIPVFDQAICTLLGWKSEVRVSFKDLREKYGFKPPEIDF